MRCPRTKREERARRTSRAGEFALEFAGGAQVAGGTTGRSHRHNAGHYVFLTVNTWDLEKER